MKCKIYFFVAILENGLQLGFSIGQSYRMDLITIEHVCHTGMPIRNGNLGNDRTIYTTTKAASVRKQRVRKIARVTRADRRRMVELREETGVQRSLTERLVRNRLQWAGHVERMADVRLPKRAADLREQGRGD